MPTAATLRPSPLAGSATVATGQANAGPMLAPQPLLGRSADPYAAPIHTPDMASPDAPTNYATPAWFLFAMSILNLIYDVFWGGIMLVGMVADNNNGDELVGFVVLLAFLVVGMVCHVTTLAGSLKMTQRRSLTLARTGAILAVIPCSACSLFQIPFAIWAMVLLFGGSASRDFVD